MEKRRQLATLAVVLIVLIAVCVRDRERALALATLVLALFAAVMQYSCCPLSGAPPACDPARESFYAYPGAVDAGEPARKPARESFYAYPGAVGDPGSPARESFVTYPGAVDAGGADDPPGPAGYGQGEHELAPEDYAAHGFPLDGDRFGDSAHPGFADNGGHPHPCLDTEAVGALAADELNVYHARHRNDPRRVKADPGRHMHLGNKYFREELDEEEDSHWWGRHEL